MAFRFNRRISLFKGLRLNLSKSGTSVSVGGRGGWLTFGKKGTRATVGIPGTGMSWSEKIGEAPPAHQPPSLIMRLVGLVGLLSAILLASIYIYAFFATVSR